MIAFQEEIFCKRSIWRCVYVFGDKNSKIGVEKYWDVFMGSKTVEFQSEKVCEWSLEELWCVLCNDIVNVYDIV